MRRTLQGRERRRVRLILPRVGAEKGKVLGDGSGQLLVAWACVEESEVRLEQCVCFRIGTPVPRRGQDGQWLRFVISPASASPSLLLLCSCVGDRAGCSFIR